VCDFRPRASDIPCGTSFFDATEEVDRRRDREWDQERGQKNAEKTEKEKRNEKSLLCQLLWQSCSHGKCGERKRGKDKETEACKRELEKIMV
jgi:hypothetical protein